MPYFVRAVSYGCKMFMKLITDKNFKTDAVTIQPENECQ
jgi:hypothetical protein